MCRLSTLALLTSVILLCLGPAAAQGNPPPADCGLPAEGMVVASATWTLDADCDQTGELALLNPSAGDPGYTITINGAGHRIRLGAGAWRFLAATDSRHTVNLNNVTIDGQFNQRPSIVDVRGTLVAQDVTFTRGRTGIFVNGAASATLNNVLFEDIISRGNGFGVNGLLNVYAGSNVTLNNAVFRKVFNNGVNVIQGGTLTTTGCLAFYGSPAYDVIHSEVWDGGGT